LHALCLGAIKLADSRGISEIGLDFSFEPGRTEGCHQAFSMVVGVRAVWV
jgi:hypothetical protein